MASKPARHGEEYKDGELEVILSTVPTHTNIDALARMLERTPNAILKVYKIAFEHSAFGKSGGIQERKIVAAKAKVGIALGRKTPRKSKATKTSKKG